MRDMKIFVIFVEIWNRMSEESLKDRVDRIKVKIQMLQSRYDGERAMRIQAESRVAELQDELTALQKDNQRLSREIEMMKITGVVASTHRDVEWARSYLSGLVREIDKCITILNH